MKSIVSGALKFQQQTFPGLSQLFKQLATTQNPNTLFITCSDSRVVPELLTQQNPGDIFVIRNAGNIVPSYSSAPGGVTATVEYAVAVLGVTDVVICGHSDCGAMTAIQLHLPGPPAGRGQLAAPRRRGQGRQRGAQPYLAAGARQFDGARKRAGAAGQYQDPPVGGAGAGTGPPDAARLGLRHRERRHRRTRRRQQSLRLAGRVPANLGERAARRPRRLIPPAVMLPSTNRKGNTMQQSNVTQDSRQALTARVITAKALKDLSWAQLCEGTGLSVAYVTAALLGQHALPKDAALAVANHLGLDAADAAELQAIPLRGSIPGGIPTDPTIYRFYEMIHIYGTTLKALVHEQFGDGIISAINFRLDIKKEDDPEGGTRSVITLNGKFLPNKPY